MKIAIDVSQIVYGTGVSTYTRNLVISLLNIDHKNNYLLFGTSLRHYSKLKKFQDELQIYKNVEFKFFRLPISLFEIIFNKIHIFPVNILIGQIDVLHTSDWVEPRVTSRQTKKVTTVHDMVPLLFPSTLPKRILKNQRLRFERVKKESDMIITDSETTREDVFKFLEIPQSRVKVIPLAVASNFKPQESERVHGVLKKFKIKRPFILSVSTQEPRKNIHKLIDAFEKVNKVCPKVTLVLTGKKGWGQALEIIPNVIQTGFVKEDDLICLYAACRVFAYPSLYEGFGLPVLEAMACGAPVVTSNNSSMAEIAKDTAVLVDPRSEGQIIKAIELIVNLDTDNYQKTVRASLDRARMFTWAKTAKETLKIYEELTKE